MSPVSPESAAFLSLYKKRLTRCSGDLIPDMKTALFHGSPEELITLRLMLDELIVKNSVRVEIEVTGQVTLWPK